MCPSSCQLLGWTSSEAVGIREGSGSGQLLGRASSDVGVHHYLMLLLLLLTAGVVQTCVLSATAIWGTCTMQVTMVRVNRWAL